MYLIFQEQFMKISDSIKFVGVNDKKIDLFEGQFKVQNGMSYNSYLIIDEKIAVMDSVDKNFGDEWLSNIKNELNGKSPDFLVVQHMEMDHSANILSFANAFPSAKIVSSKMAFNMMASYFGTDFADRQIVVAEGSVLDLGNHKLNFIAAPNVHWPEVIMTYEETEKILFSADGFGKFGALDKDEDWLSEARRYYFGIVGKFGANVQAVLKKAANLKIDKICPLHGPVLDSNVEYYIEKYSTWSSYTPETKGIFIPYTSVYGNTKKVVQKLEKSLVEKGAENVLTFDLARGDIYEAVSKAFEYSTVIFATTTYNTGIFPFMREFITDLKERNFQNRRVGFIENSSWAPMAIRTMNSMLENSKDLTYLENNISIKIAPNDKTDSLIEAMADELLK